MASYSIDRPSSPPFEALALKPPQRDLVGADVPETSFILDSMAADASSSVENGGSNGVLPSAGAALPPLSTMAATTGSALLESVTLSPEVVARLEQIVANFRNTNANGNSAANGTWPQPSPSLRSASGNDAELDPEKQRHKETKQVLAIAQARLESLVAEVDELNNDIEGFRANSRSLNDKIQAKEIENARLHRRLEELSQVEQQLKFQMDTQRALEARLQLEMEDRRATHNKLVVSQHAHDKELVAFAAERKAHVAVTETVKEQQEQIRELQQQLDAANKRMAMRDRMLVEAEAEKRSLQAMLFDARHNIEDTAAVFGEASLAFNAEVDRAMSMLLSMKLSPRATPPAAAAQPALPPTPPRG